MNFSKGDSIVHKDHPRLRAEVLFTFNDAFTNEPMIDIRWLDSKLKQKNIGLKASDFIPDPSTNF